MIYVYCWGVCGAVREMRAARLATISISPFSYCLNFFVGPFFIAGPRRHCSLSTTVRSLPLRIHDDHHHSPQNSAIKSWDKFYKRHQNKFFKDRHYLEKDWGQYFSDDNSESPNGKVVLEVGCGAGNTIFPLVAAYPKLFVHACDFSPQAITLVKIFMLSAVCPEKMPLILLNIKKVLKPDGYVLLRDYALGDYAQVKLQNKNQMVSENFYIRGDGTCSFYFSEDSLSALFTRSGFNIIDMNIYCRQIENRSRNITMDRRWIRAICSLP
ncbi:tRNA N(3)-methylcytidine methyltransferase trm141-like isoform X2 [Cornus florida]|uniref:tRNA N(3)-methylcytidine methyltransferase trm141-like isoform X2 n=1 Tax=Cornus florida TaxID=4283 RepID=UPI00289E324A|nr:tRNA N(3)-methylcytidine methyltransferase trm141-like isoform X2 [Cornus florida]